MPLYQFECVDCHESNEEVRPVELCSTEGQCLICGGVTERRFTAPSSVIVKGGQLDSLDDFMRAQMTKQAQQAKQQFGVDLSIDKTMANLAEEYRQVQSVQTAAKHGSRNSRKITRSASVPLATRQAIVNSSIKPDGKRARGEEIQQQLKDRGILPA